MLLHMLAVMFVFTFALINYAFAQVPDSHPMNDTWEVLLKVLFPAIWTAVAPFVTKGITALLLKAITYVPPSAQVLISSVVGAVIAGAAGAIPDFPLTIESAAEMGAAGGASGQILANMHPNEVQPKEQKQGAVQVPEVKPGV